MILLLPADPLRPRRPDEHYAAEAAQARENGLAVALVDHDELTRTDGVPLESARAAVARVPRGQLALYRGWMLHSRQYDAFAQALRERDVSLVTDPVRYRRAHELPGWYEALREVTPRTVWTEGPLLETGFDEACRRLGTGPAVLRDYTKSMKHYWHEAAFIPSIEDVAAARKVASRFRDLRGDEFTGGYVLRRYEPFTSSEARTWWIGGRCVLAGPHPDTPADLPEGVDTAPFAPLVAGLGLPFVTLDLARRDDGVWRVVELGDGQVSDCPTDLLPLLVPEYTHLGFS